MQCIQWLLLGSMTVVLLVAGVHARGCTCLEYMFVFAGCKRSPAKRSPAKPRTARMTTSPAQGKGKAKVQAGTKGGCVAAQHSTAQQGQQLPHQRLLVCVMY